MRLAQPRLAEENPMITTADALALDSQSRFQQVQRDLAIGLTHWIGPQLGQPHPAPGAGTAFEASPAPPALKHVQGQLEVGEAVI